MASHPAIHRGSTVTQKFSLWSTVAIPLDFLCYEAYNYCLFDPDTRFQLLITHHTEPVNTKVLNAQDLWRAFEWVGLMRDWAETYSNPADENGRQEQSVAH